MDMDLQQARTIARSPYAASRAKVDEAVALLGKVVDRVEARIGALPPDPTQDHRPMPLQWRDAPRYHGGGDAA